MKRKSTIILSIVTIISMLLMLTGCGASEQKKFIGTWEATIDMTDYINEGLEEDEETAEYLKLDSFAIVVRLTFNENGTYKMELDEDAAEKTLKSAQEAFSAGMTKYFEDYISSMGLSMSVDEVLALSGVSMDELIEEAFGDALLQSLTEELSSEGNFKVKDGKLYMSDGLDAAIDEEVYETYEISGSELKLIESSDVDEEEFNLYPLVLKKIK